MRVGSPKIEFPELEKKILGQWEEDQTFYKSNEQRKGSKEFTFYDGPPFANGLPHYGHILGQTLKDIVPRYWNMRGHYVERRFGWDCHGLPVEFEIEKKLGLKGRQDVVEYGVDKFNEACRASVLEYVSEWKKTVTRLGRWVDWNNQYKTMDKNFMESVWWAFKELDNRELLYKDVKIIAYSPRITAVVSNFEANLNYKEVQDPSVSIKFKLQDEDAYFVAWTTTPWTLISNLALCVGPEVRYVKLRDKENDEIYYMAKECLEFVYKKSKKNKEPKYEVIKEVSAAELTGVKYEPLFPYFPNEKNAYQVLCDDFVSTGSGTGIVHCAPAYGEDDNRICKVANIDLVDPLDAEANFTDAIPEYKGQYIKDADKLIIKRLKDEGKLLRQDVIVHSYPHCDRTEDPLIYRAIPTWYINVVKNKELMIENNKTINWVPGHIKAGRMGKWLENARDWGVSRNRFWGTPLPIWVSDKDPDTYEVIGSVAELEEKCGEKVGDLHKHFVDELTWSCAKTGGTMRRVPEVFDCWFESGSMPYAQTHYPFENKETFGQKFPADFIAEGQDQTRGWFYTLAVLSSSLFGKPAFKNVIVNGIIQAEDGCKMSKRLRNYTAPDLLFDKYGADSVRLYMVNSPVVKGDELKFSDTGVKDTTRAVLLPLWNAFSFLTTYADADGWKPSPDFAKGKAPSSDNELDRWIISKLQTVKANIHKEMELYKIYNVVPQILSFLEDLTNWYIRLSRRRFWGSGDSMSGDTKAAYGTLYYVLVEFTQLFAPFAPFISERVYQDLTEGMAEFPKSVHLCDMPLENKELVDQELESKMELIRTATNLGRSLRAKHQIKTRQALPSMMIITRRPNDAKHIESGMAVIKSELNIKKIEFTTEEAKYVRLSVKPNFKTLGKKLGKDINSLRNHLNDLNKSHDDVANLLGQLEGNGSTEICGHSLSEDDFLIDRGPKDDRLIATEKGVTVLLDTTLTEELILEGLAREVVNRVQNLRKDSGLQVSDRIKVEVCADPKLQEALVAHKDYVSGETLMVDLKVDGSNEGISSFEHHADFDIDGMACKVGISVQG